MRQLPVPNINFQSIKRKRLLVNNIIESSKPDIVLGTETWLKPNIINNEVFPENYSIYCKDRIDKEGGGVLLAKHQMNHYNLTTTLEDTGLCQLRKSHKE
jgi:hypothetical protein